MQYFSLAYYRYTPIEDPQLEVERHKAFFEGRDVTGRIYISSEGINGQMSGDAAGCESYMQWLRSDPRFHEIPFKIHPCKENIFPRMTVKVRSQLVALDCKVDLANAGEHLSPDAWKKVLETEEDILLIDVRNRYEWEIGHFENADLPPFEQFRDFPRYADALAEKIDRENTKVLMYCTGGIRCETYSALLKEKGIKNVYQLEGGILGYGLAQGGDHWKGKVFVFDDRLAIPISDEESKPIAHCKHCGAPEDTYYNCANMDCNELFIACPACSESKAGCCSTECQSAPRVRAFTSARGNKPFRRKHLIEGAE